MMEVLCAKAMNWIFCVSKFGRQGEEKKEEKKTTWAVSKAHTLSMVKIEGNLNHFDAETYCTANHHASHERLFDCND